MREVLLGAAAAGLFTPLWSPRVLEEWARATRKIGPEGETIARAEIAALRRDWPKAEVQPAEAVERRLWLPDPADIHVLAAAIAGSADVIVTVNARDFPRNTLAEEGLARVDPDALLTGFASHHPDAILRVGQAVRDRARALSGEDWQIRALMRKARLPRLGKTLARLEDG